jgi:hypothetical protein
MDKFLPVIPFSRDLLNGDGLFWIVSRHRQGRRAACSLLLLLILGDRFILGSSSLLWFLTLPLSLATMKLSFMFIVWLAWHCLAYSKTLIQEGDGFRIPNCAAPVPLFIETRKLYTQRFFAIYVCVWEVTFMFQRSEERRINGKVNNRPF